MVDAGAAESEVDMNSLLRYLDTVNSPIVSLGTSLQPGLLRPFYWYSITKLAPTFNDRFSYRFELPVYGAGWAASKLESQSKAIVEAVERSAHFQYRTRPSDAALDIDRSTTGFAAAPREFGIEFIFNNGLNEALERWMLNRISDGNPTPFEEIPLSRVPFRFRILFLNSGGRLRVFRACIRGQSSRFLKASTIEFVLAVLEMKSGGIIPGSACGGSFPSAVEHAILEVFNHHRKVNRILEGREQLPPKITTQCLWHYRFNKIAALRIVEHMKDWSKVGLKSIDGPDIQFEKELEGPWNPEVRIARVLVENSLPLEEGGLDRLLV